MNIKRYRRKEAAQALSERGYPTSAARLAKLAVYGGGPEFTYWGRYPVYAEDRLLAWAEANVSKLVRNTSERRAA